MCANGARQAPVCHRLRVAAVIPETADAVSLVFGLTERQRERFRYRQILDADDIAEGYVLACQAIPVTRQVRISLD